jgi:hypothetical protein
MVPSFAGQTETSGPDGSPALTAAGVFSIQGKIRKTKLLDRNSSTETSQSPVLDAERAAGTATTSAG